jgi:hypothetical protein
MLAALLDDAAPFENAALPAVGAASPPPPDATSIRPMSAIASPAADLPLWFMRTILSAFQPSRLSGILLNLHRRDGQKLVQFRTSPRATDTMQPVNAIDASTAATTPRDVVIGAGSRVWQTLAPHLGADAARFIALRHADAARFEYRAGDRVWILAYSRRPEENLKLFEHLRGAASSADFIYVASSACIVTRVTRCYEYPRVKQQAAEAARRVLDARVLTLGLVHEQLADLPRGSNAATSLDQLGRFMRAPAWPAARDAGLPLFCIVSRPFSGAAETALYRAYGLLLRACGAWPCLLRPMDAVLRALGIRWYGYVFLSNRLWTAKS